jgi:hypothetical protein
MVNDSLTSYFYKFSTLYLQRIREKAGKYDFAVYYRHGNIFVGQGG